MLGAIGGVIGGVLGTIGSNQQADRQRADQQKAFRRQYEYDMDMWEFRSDEANRDYKWLRNGVNIQRQNQEQELQYREQTQLQDYQHALKIQDYEHRQQMRMFQESKRIYGLQLKFNSMAAAAAREAEIRKLQEAVVETAFENQDLFVEMMQVQGQQMAKGVAGRSVAKGIQSVLAEAGRSQEVLAESLRSANRNTNAQLRKIRADKYGADIRAEANRMLRPERMPELPKPLPIPRAVLQDPRRPREAPKPIMGVAAPSQSTGWAGVASSALSNSTGLLNMIKFN